MRMSKLFGNTYREDPSDTHSIGLRYLLRAGFIRPVSEGFFAILPPGYRVLENIRRIIRREMTAVSGQEIILPFPESDPGANQKQRQDNNISTPNPGANSHDGVGILNSMVRLARREIKSHRHLPRTVYRFFPAGHGFEIQEAFSFHPDGNDLDLYYPLIYQAYLSAIQQCGVSVTAANADSVGWENSTSHEFVTFTDAGTVRVYQCDSCGIVSTKESATIRPPVVSDSMELLPKKEVATPGKETIAEVMEFLGLPQTRTMKAVFFNVNGELVLAALRGDFDVSEKKVLDLLHAATLAPASAELLAEHGMTPGYASPLNLPSDIKILVDRSLQWGKNFVAGANKHGYHVENVNFPRDIQVDRFVDIALAREGDGCPECTEGALRKIKCVRLAQLQKYRKPVPEIDDLTFMDRDHQRKNVFLGRYQLDIGQLFKMIVEEHHDDFGICWPQSVAPWQVHLVSLASGSGEVHSVAERIYGELQAGGIETLYDDRKETPGVKFNDADLMGCPLRVTVSRRSLKTGAIEMKSRKARRVETAKLHQAAGMIRAYLESQFMLSNTND